jgi:hypothetical protein
MAAGGVDLGLIAAMDQHFRALADEALSHRIADAGRGAGDENGLACKSAHEMGSPLSVMTTAAAAGRHVCGETSQVLAGLRHPH